MSEWGQEWASGMLSKDVTFKLFVSGPLGAKELGNLIKKLEIDRALLLDAERPSSPPETASAEPSSPVKPAAAEAAPVMPKPIPPRPSRVTSTTAGPSPHSPFCDEIVNIIPALFEENPKGPTGQQIADALGARYADVRRALITLDRAGRIKYDRRADSPGLHALPADLMPPPCDLTTKQAAMLKAIVAVEKDGLAAISQQSLIEESSISRGEVFAILDALVKKNYISVEQNGSAGQATVYRIKRFEPYRIYDRNKQRKST